MDHTGAILGPVVAVAFGIGAGLGGAAAVLMVLFVSTTRHSVEP
jgi:hypothetical protein